MLRALAVRRHHRDRAHPPRRCSPSGPAARPHRRAGARRRRTRRRAAGAARRARASGRPGARPHRQGPAPQDEDGLRRSARHGPGPQRGADLPADRPSPSVTRAERRVQRRTSGGAHREPTDGSRPASLPRPDPATECTGAGPSRSVETARQGRPRHHRTEPAPAGAAGQPGAAAPPEPSHRRPEPTPRPSRNARRKRSRDLFSALQQGHAQGATSRRRLRTHMTTGERRDE